MNRVIVVGGGASGLVAAIFAAQEGNCQVTVLEQNSRFGKKLVCTGNGKCNLTNLQMDATSFRGTNPGFARAVLKKFSCQDTILFFSKIGVYTKNKNDYIYPNSEQASSVLELLEAKARSLNIKLKTMQQVLEIKKKKDFFEVVTKGWTYESEKVILSCGSSASSVEGSTDLGYRLAKQSGHTIITPLPALVAVQGKGDYFGRWAGVRAKAAVTLVIQDIRLKSEVGEVQFTDYGLSGIPVFQLSRYISRVRSEGHDMKIALSLDFFPDFTLEALEAFLKTRKENCPYLKKEELLVGLVPKKLISILAAPEDTLFDIALKLKDFVVEIENTLSIEHAQVACGGVSTDELDENTLESKMIPGLYITGELVDIDGACGGYNLQWAWSSAALAGKAAGK